MTPEHTHLCALFQTQKKAKKLILCTRRISFFFMLVDIGSILDISAITPQNTFEINCLLLTCNKNYSIWRYDMTVIKCCG